MAWDWLETLGRTALRAAPYVAAPFTGGMSLYTIPAANMAADRWGQSDINQGEGQQGFERWASPIGHIAGLGSMFTGGYGLANMGRGASAASGIGRNAAGLPTDIPGGTTYGMPNMGGGGGGLFSGRNLALMGAGVGGGLALGSIFNRGGGSDGNTDDRGAYYQASPVMPRGGFNYRNNPMYQSDQSNPNLAHSIFQGRYDAMANQPFRRGYNQFSEVPNPNFDSEAEVVEPEFLTQVTRMPSIFPYVGRGGRIREASEELPRREMRRQMRRGRF